MDPDAIDRVVRKYGAARSGSIAATRRTRLRATFITTVARKTALSSKTCRRPPGIGIRAQESYNPEKAASFLQPTE
jgi:hypothetical protein